MDECLYPLNLTHILTCCDNDCMLQQPGVYRRGNLRISQCRKCDSKVGCYSNGNPHHNYIRSLSLEALGERVVTQCLSRSTATAWKQNMSVIISCRYANFTLDIRSRYDECRNQGQQHFAPCTALHSMLSKAELRQAYSA